MSGIETVRVIVEAEKKAENIISEAQAQALQIRKNVDVLIQKEREDSLSSTGQNASSITQRAELDGKSEAAQYERESEQNTRETLQGAMSKKESAIKALYDMIMK